MHSGCGFLRSGHPEPAASHTIANYRSRVPLVDAGEAVESPQRLSDDTEHARRLLELVPEMPTPVWGRDELETGEMWNSNSFISWLITRSDLDVDTVRLPRAVAPPVGTRALCWRSDS
jgi:hypothetical protein